MAVSVQGWRKKWFYIQDQKDSSSDQFGIAPFDAKAKLTKLTSWDSPPTEAEVNNIQPLLARIQALKSATDNSKILTFVLSVDLYVVSCFFSFFLRITDSWFLTLLSPRGDNSKLILLLVTLKPLRLMSAREEMML
jgi:hypothetical protein